MRFSPLEYESGQSSKDEVHETKRNYGSFLFPRVLMKRKTEPKVSIHHRSWRIETHGLRQDAKERGTSASSCPGDMMENPADTHVDVQADLPVQLSDDGIQSSADDAGMEDSMSEASTDAYGSNDDVREYLSDDEDDESSGDTSLEDVVGEESAQILRLTVVYARELHTEILNAQALLNRIRTRLVRHGYGRNTCGREESYYSLYMYCQTKLENRKDFLRTVLTRLDELRSLLALEGVHLD